MDVAGAGEGLELPKDDKSPALLSGLITPSKFPSGGFKLGFRKDDKDNLFCGDVAFGAIAVPTLDPVGLIEFLYKEERRGSVATPSLEPAGLSVLPTEPNKLGKTEAPAEINGCDSSRLSLRASLCSCIAKFDELTWASAALLAAFELMMLPNNVAPPTPTATQLITCLLNLFCLIL